MTRDEIFDLLTLAASYDRRTAGNADADAWELAIGDLPLADSMAAVVAHYSESTDWLMPAHVRNGVRAIRDARLAAAPPLEYTDEVNADPAKFLAAKRMAERAIADGNPDPLSLPGLRAIEGGK